MWKSIVLLSVLFLASYSAASELQMRANNVSEYSYSLEGDSTYHLESWTDINFTKEKFIFDFTIDALIKPVEWGDATEEKTTLATRTFTYKEKDWKFSAGNFTTVFGNGLVLRTFRDNTIRWNNDIDGIYFNYDKDWVDFKVMGGHTRDNTGKRLGKIQGGDLNVMPNKHYSIGLTFISNNEQYTIDSIKVLNNHRWGSLYSTINFPQWGIFEGSMDLEFAARLNNADYFDFGGGLVSMFPKGAAIYNSTNLFIGDLAMVVQYKDYRGFDHNYGVRLNDAPTVYKQHVTALPSKTQRGNVEANNDKGIFIEATHPVVEDVAFTIDYSRNVLNTESLFDVDQPIYEEYYGEFEVNLYEDYPFNVGGGVQESIEGTFLNFVSSAQAPVMDDYNTKFGFQHQHKAINTNEEEYFKHFLFGTLYAPEGYNLTLQAELEYKHEGVDNYIAASFNYDVTDQFRLSTFIGARSAGKDCSGGICIEKAEFSGVEIITTTRF